MRNLVSNKRMQSCAQEKSSLQHHPLKEALRVARDIRQRSVSIMTVRDKCQGTKRDTNRYCFCNDRINPIVSLIDFPKSLRILDAPLSRNGCSSGGVSTALK